MNFLWGIDLGGSKIEGVVLQESDLSAPLARVRVETQAERGYSHILSRVSSLIQDLSRQFDLIPDKIGFGTPGILDPQTSTLKNSNTQCLNGMPLKADLENILGVEVTLANDANCFSLAEATLGSGRGAKSVFGVIIGTGVGGGVVIDGALHSGYHGIAGEWGHNVLIESGAPCYCGKRGCVETVISGPALEGYYAARGGESLSLEEIAARASAGDAIAEDTIERLCVQFGRAISAVINILDPEIIVLGGGVSNIDLLYARAPAEIQKSIFNNRVSCKIVKHSLGDSAGVFGAAMLTSNGKSSRNETGQR